VANIDGFCVVDYTPHTRIFFTSVFVTALVLIVLMLSGVLRWREARVKGGTWWLLYKQVSPSRLAAGADAALVLWLTLTIRAWYVF